MLTSCVHPDGRFRVGVHQPSYTVRNLREREFRGMLGQLPDGREVDNAANFPEGDIHASASYPVYEIANALPFRGCTYIDAGWAAARSLNPASIAIRPQPPLSLRQHLAAQGMDEAAVQQCVKGLPLQLRYALAATSGDAQELIWLAETCCIFIYAEASNHDNHGNKKGLLYEEHRGRLRPAISDMELFETVANNPHLPDSYKEVMVLRPGAQGTSPITADEHHDGREGGQGGAVFEYLRANSYIPGGHYAANFAHTSRRYSIAELSLADMRGLRRLYYQRMYTVLAGQFGLAQPEQNRTLSCDELEVLRMQVCQAALNQEGQGIHPATLWGWNFGYDFSPTGYRLHASHQMIHQQYALVPEQVVSSAGGVMPAFACGDLVADWAARYSKTQDSDFFSDYLRCIRANIRTDGGAGESSLIVWQDENVLLFAPKAQVSQWELNLMAIADGPNGPVGNVVEADASVRASIDMAMLIAQQVLARLGATMVTSIEYSKRLGVRNSQRLLYAFLPKLPWAMGGFTEAQARYVVGHYPEDFAAACRLQVQEIRA